MGTLVQTGGTVQAGSDGATFNFTGTGFQWQAGHAERGFGGLDERRLVADGE
jgi:hypothetical protein